MRILVTGGAGYVGRSLLRRLYRQHDVAVVDRLDFGIGRLSAEDRANIELHAIDIADTDAVRDAVGGFAPDAIIHLAATHFIPQCEKDPAGTVSTNVRGTVNLLQSCPPACRFVFASSGAVYAPSEVPHLETAETDPRDVYGFTKWHGEHFTRYFSTLRGFPAAVVRLFNVVGPGETNPHLLPEIVAQMKAGYDSIRLGNIWPKRDYIHVEDAAAGFEAVATRGTVAPGETVTVNLGTSQQYSVGEIVDRLRAVSGWHFDVVQDSSRMRAVDRSHLGAAIGEIAHRFGWAPTRTIDDAVADLWANPDLSDGLRAQYGLERPAERAPA